MKKSFILFVFLLCSIVVVAQKKSITGIITDTAGEAVIGASIVEVGTTNGTVSDVDGNFTLSVSDNASIQVSFIGFSSQTLSVQGKMNFKIILKEDSELLQEVVVTGYGGKVSRAKLTNSISTVSPQILEKGIYTNPSQALSGSVPGLKVSLTSGNPTSSPKVILRGGTEFDGSGGPLVIVDGQLRDNFDDINPQDIASMDVLKDAGATAIYGARASNGVILITTKRGKEGKPVVSFNASAGFSQPTRLPKMTNSYEYATMLNEVLPGSFSDEQLEGFRTHANPWKYPDTDWFDEIVKGASPLYRADIGVSGGTEKVKYYANFGANGEDGLYRNSANRYDQYSLRTNLDVKTSKYVDFQLGVTARLEDTKYPAKGAGDIFGAARRSRPDQVAWWPSGEPGPAVERGDNPAVTSTDLAGFDHYKNQYIQNNLSVNIKVPWIEGLTLRGNGSYDIHFQNRRLMKKPVYLYTWDGTTEGSEGLSASKQWLDTPQLERKHSEQIGWMLNGLIDYNRTFGQHTIGVTFGMEGQKKQYEETWAFRQGFISDSKPELSLGGEEGQSARGYSWKETRLNYFGRASYNYLERYLFEFVWRVDGSYRFPKESRYGFFPGVSLAWRASEENWWKDNIRFIDYFKLRGSVSQTGNDALVDGDGNYDHSIQYLTTYAFNNAGTVFGGQENKRLYPSRTPNPNITWEVGTTYNVGLDFKFLQNRLSWETDVFYHKRTNMLISRNASLPEITGITLPRENLGEMKNRGFESLVSWQDKIGEVEYGASLNMTYARNEITFWDEVQNVPEYQFSTGRPVGSRNMLLYVADGIFHTQAEIDEARAKGLLYSDNTVPGDIRFKDMNGDGKIDGLDRIRPEKNQEPRFVAGLTLTAKWKGFDLMMLWQGATGAEVYIETWSGLVGNFLKSDYDKRWTPENPYSEGPRTWDRENQYWINNDNTYFMRNANYLRLKNIELGYTFNFEGLKKAGISNLRLYTNGTNLITIDGVKDADPEQRDASLGGYPLRKIINFGVQATF